jgi:hypothetical protein
MAAGEWKTSSWNNAVAGAGLVYVLQVRNNNSLLSSMILRLYGSTVLLLRGLGKSVGFCILLHLHRRVESSSPCLFPLYSLQNYRTFTPLSPSQDDYDPFSLRR